MFRCTAVKYKIQQHKANPIKYIALEYNVNVLKAQTTFSPILTKQAQRLIGR